MDSYLGGKTYIAACLSFLPSSISKYKFTWGWGRFSSMQLIGWNNHTGFHAGKSTEAFFNFGWIGVILTSVIKAYFFSMTEKIFRAEIFDRIVNNQKFDYLIVILLFLVMNFSNLFNITSDANVFFLLIAFIIVNVIFTSMLRKWEKIKEKQRSF